MLTRLSTEMKWLGCAIAAIVLALPPAPAGAATSVDVPKGTKVGLEFLTPVYTATNVKGDKVKFRVVSDVLIGRTVVIKQGTPLTGTVTSTTGPGRFGRPAKMTIGYLAVNAVDHKPLALNDFVISPDNAGTQRAKAVGVATGVALLSHSAWGLLGGAVVKGGNVEVPVGAVEGVTTQTGATIKVP